MTHQAQLSKSQFLKGKQCPKCLWFSRNRKDLTPPIDPAKQAIFDAGHEVGEWAKKCFPNGVEVTEPYYKIKESAEATSAFMATGHDVIFEATAIHPDGTYSRIDVLRKSSDADAWEMIEVKGSTEIKDYHFDDTAFQYRVFTGAGYRIGKCYLMLIDNAYVRNGDIEPQSLFKLEDITDFVLENQFDVDELVPELLDTVQSPDEPFERIGARCFKPFDCDYIHHCWKAIPDYSIYNVFSKKKADEIVESLGSYEVKNLPTELLPTGRKQTDVISYMNGDEYVEQDNIREFLEGLEYPLYYLDYETIASAIPFFNGTRPFQQIPFQFSLHIEDHPDATLRHHEFLHKEPTDPRPAFIEALIRLCGNTGSVIVYNQPFEEGVNRALADSFPVHASSVEAISKRMVDLLVPFRKRWLYHPDQHSSASIKKVLPAFTDLSYEGMGIDNGQEASLQYASFVEGRLSLDDQAELWNNLSVYCTLDTFAMKALMDVLREKVRKYKSTNSFKQEERS